MSRVNLPLMLVSVLISLMLWFVVFGQSLPAPESIALKVDLNNSKSTLENPNLQIDYDRTPARINLKFFGPRRSLDDVRDRDPVVVVDLSHAKPGTNRYPAELDPSSFNNLLFNKTLTVPVTLYELEHRQVPIQVVKEGVLKDQSLMVAETKASREMADVSGPASMVDKVDHCRAWFNLAEVDPKNPGPQTANLAALDADGTPYPKLEIDPVQIAITPIVTAAPVTGTAVVTPQFVGSPALGFVPRDYRMEPNAVQLTGDPTVLAATTRVLTEPIDVNGLTYDRVFHVKLRVPPQLQVVGRRTVTVIYRVAPDPSYRSGAQPTPGSPSSNTFPSTVPPLNGAKGGGP